MRARRRLTRKRPQMGMGVAPVRPLSLVWRQVLLRRACLRTFNRNGRSRVPAVVATVADEGCIQGESVRMEVRVFPVALFNFEYGDQSCATSHSFNATASE